MLNPQEFDGYQIPHDEFNDKESVLRLHDLPLKDNSLPIRLSYCMGVTGFRRNQIQRTLETLARQNWREFEVLVGDDGSDQDLYEVVQRFRPYLRIAYVRTERVGFSACPSRAFKNCLEVAKGEIFAVGQPEIMLHPNACEILYMGHFMKYGTPELSCYVIDELANENKTGRPATDWDWNRECGYTWVTLKPGFLNREMTKMLDYVDWHGNVGVLESLPGYWNSAPGLSNRPNTYWSTREWVPWWFVGSAPREDYIWQDMPITRGHASIDLWLLNYRKIMQYVDIMPRQVMGYHQDHVRGSVSPKGEQDGVSPESVRRFLHEHSRSIPTD